MAALDDNVKNVSKLTPTYFFAVFICVSSHSFWLTDFLSILQDPMQQMNVCFFSILYSLSKLNLVLVSTTLLLALTVASPPTYTYTQHATKIQIYP